MMQTNERPEAIGRALRTLKALGEHPRSRSLRQPARGRLALDPAIPPTSPTTDVSLAPTPTL